MSTPRASLKGQIEALPRVVPTDMTVEQHFECNSEYVQLASVLTLLDAEPEQGWQDMADAAEMLWVVLANVSGGDWTKQTPDWQEYAARWRDNYFEALKRVAPPRPSSPAVEE